MSTTTRPHASELCRQCAEPFETHEPGDGVESCPGDFGPDHGAFPEVTREQEQRAEALAFEFATVEVRNLPGDFASLICRDEQGLALRIFLVNADGEDATHAERAARTDGYRAEWSAAARARDAGALRDIARRALMPWPQYDGEVDRCEVFEARQSLTTKGGLAWEKGDLLLARREPSFGLEPRRISGLSPHRFGWVQDAYTLRAV